MWSSILVWGFGMFLRLCFMLLVFSSSPLFLLRLSIGTVQTMHWRWSTTFFLVGMSVSVCRDASLQFHAEHWELMVMIGDPVVDACEPVARRECWITRVARETVFQPLQSDTDALLDQPCCQGDCTPALAIRHGRSLGPAVLPWRLHSGLCDLTRTLCWISRVAREIVCQPLQSDTEACCTRRV